MTHECGCHGDPGVALEDTVADVVRRDPGALEVLKALGINHCCGAHLTLAEAAAAAGVTRDAMLDALRAARKVSA